MQCSALGAWREATVQGHRTNKLIAYIVRKMTKVWLGGVSRRWRNLAKEAQQLRTSRCLRQGWPHFKRFLLRFSAQAQSSVRRHLRKAQSEETERRH